MDNNTQPEKCYIIGKIGDLPEEVYKANFEQAKKEVEALGYLPVSPVDLDHNHDKKWASYMKTDIKAMLDCQAVYAQKNWFDSPGGKVEVFIALKLGIPIYYQSAEESLNAYTNQQLVS